MRQDVLDIGNIKIGFFIVYGRFIHYCNWNELNNKSDRDGQRRQYNSPASLQLLLPTSNDKNALQNEKTG